MKLIYPAVFTPYFDESGYEVMIPDLKGCTASGDTLEEAIDEAVDQASMWILSRMEKGEDIPPASAYSEIHTDDGRLFRSPQQEGRAEEYHDPRLAERLRGGEACQFLPSSAERPARSDPEK